MIDNLETLEAERQRLENAKLAAETMKARYFWLSSVGGLVSAILTVVVFILQYKSSTISAQAKESESQREILSGEYDRLTQELSNLQREKDSAVAEHTALIRQNAILGKQLSNLNDSIKTATTTREALLADLDRIRADLQQSIKDEENEAHSRSTYKTYSGTAGSQPISLRLTWHSTGLVEGTYVYTNDNRVYTLRGSNFENGKLLLAEFNGETKTAEVELSKSQSSGKITWSGTMKNTDGRRFPFRFERNL